MTELNCIKCNTLMIQHEDVYTCLLCEARVRVNWMVTKEDIKASKFISQHG